MVPTYRILHRDIKPQNIGFDIRGDIKIFDLGLAKELKPIDKEGKDQFHTSGLAGTRRYMAPEVCLRDNYGTKVDVYSWAIAARDSVRPAPLYAIAATHRSIPIAGLGDLES